MGEVLRVFEAPMKDYIVDEVTFKPPIYKFAGSRSNMDKYFACIQKNMVLIYECPEMNLLDKKPMRLENVLDFSFSPIDALLSTY